MAHISTAVLAPNISVHKPVFSAVMLALGLALGGTVLAQDAQGEAAAAEAGLVLEEVIVTASRRNANLQDIPITVTAITSETINDFNLTRITDFMNLVPNAVVESGSFSINDTIVIRGVGLALDFIEQGTGVYENGYYIGGMRTVFSDFVDLERVEVLRGPQGALYGRNAVGGAVNFVYNAPKLDKFEGLAEMQYREWGRIEARGVVNLPVAEDQFAIRLASWFVDQEEGEYYNTTLGEWQDDRRVAGFRASALWQAAENLDLTFWADVTSEEGPENHGAAEVIGGESKKNVQRDTPSEAQKDWTLYGLTVNWDTAIGTVSSLTSFREYQLDSLADQDGWDQKTLAFQTIHRDEEVDSVFQELRLVSADDRALKYIVGYNYFAEDLRLYRPVNIMDPTGALLGVSATAASIDAKSNAVFGELTWTIADDWDLIGSVRRTEEDKDFDFDRTFTGRTGVFLDRSDDWDNTSWGGGVVWRTSDDVQLYFRANEGFRAGGYNTGFNFGVDPDLAAQIIPYDQETSLNLELGAKTSWFNRRLTVNAAVFNLKQDDVLGGIFDFSSFNFFFQNLGESETDGIEFDFAAIPIENLTLTGSFGYIDGEITEVADVPGAFVTLNPGDPIPGGKSTNWSLGGTYRIPMSSDLNWVLSAMWNRNYHREPYVAGAVEGAEFFDYSLIDVAVGLESPRWSVTGFINNLTDDDYVLSQALYNPGNSFPFPGRPVTTRYPGQNWGVRAMFRF